MDEKLVIQITAEINDLKKRISDAKDEVKSLASDADGTGSKIDTAFKNAGTSIKNGMKVATTAAAGVVSALVAFGPATEAYRMGQAKLNSAWEAAGKTADEAASAYNDLYRFMGDSDTAVEAANHLAQLNLTAGENEALVYSLQGVYATFGDSLPIEGLAEVINHSAKVGEVQGSLADALEWAGINLEDFNAKLGECANETERAQLIQQTLSETYDGSADALEKNAAGILASNAAQAQLDAAMAATGEAMAPVMTMLKELGADVLTAIQPYIQDFADNYLPTIRDVLGEVGTKLSETITWMKEHQTLLGVIAGIIGTITVAIGLYNVVAAVKAAMDAAQVTTLGALAAAYLAQAAAMAIAIAPYVLIVAAIAAVIAIIVLCVKHWDEIKAKVKEVWDNIKQKTEEAVEKVKQKFEDMKAKLTEKVENIKKNITEKFEAIKTGIQEKINAAKEVVSNVFEAIKSVIQNKIELAKTIITNVLAAIKGIFTGDFGAAKEAVLNIFNSIKDGIKNKIESARDFVKGAIDKIKGFMNFKWELPKLKLPHFNISGKFSLNPPSAPNFSVKWYQKGGVFDEPALFGYGGGNIGGLGENGAEAIVPLEKNTEWMNVLASKLGALMGGSNNTPIVLQVDGKTFAQVTCDSINQLTRQRGSIPLNVI